MVFPQFSPARVLGTVKDFELYMADGYETCAFGRGEWIGDKRIVAIWVLKGPNVPIKAVYQPKTDEAGLKLRGSTREKEFASEEKLDEFLNEWKISIFGATSLKTVLKEFFQHRALETAGQIEEFLQSLYDLDWRQMTGTGSFDVWLYRHNQRLAKVRYDGSVCRVLYHEETMPASEAVLLSEVLKCKFDFESISLSTL